MSVINSKAVTTQAYVRRDGRLALYRERADPAYWNATWHRISDQVLKHILRETRQLGPHRRFFRRWLPHEGVILEAGCGTGIWVRRLRANGWMSIGVDYAVQSLIRSKELCPMLPLAGADVFKLPFRDSSVSAYLSFGVVEHFLDGPGYILRECTRVLSDGGIALISVPYANRLRQSVSTLSEKQAQEMDLEFYQYYFTQRDFAEQLALAGLKVMPTFHGYGVNNGWAGPLSSIRKLIQFLGPASTLLDYIPGLPRLAAHMMFLAARKASVEHA